MESFFRSFKVEEVYWNEYETHEQATRGRADFLCSFFEQEAAERAESE